VKMEVGLAHASSEAVEQGRAAVVSALAPRTRPLQQDPVKPRAALADPG